jgi:hypothetical protein
MPRLALPIVMLCSFGLSGWLLFDAVSGKQRPPSTQPETLHVNGPGTLEFGNRNVARTVTIFALTRRF